MALVDIPQDKYNVSVIIPCLYLSGKILIKDKQTKGFPLRGSCRAYARLMRCSHAVALKIIDDVLVTDAKHPTPHPSFASQNPPSPQGEGFGAGIGVMNYITLSTRSKKHTLKVCTDFILGHRSLNLYHSIYSK